MATGSSVAELRRQLARLEQWQAQGTHAWQRRRLSRKLGLRSSQRFDARVLGLMLERWEAEGSAGLPQHPQAAQLLSELLRRQGLDPYRH